MLNNLKQNRILTVIFRSAALILCIMGILMQAGVFDGSASARILLFYTIQSNILTGIYFAIVLTLTFKKIKKEGICGSSSFYERFGAMTMIAISLTMVVFWLLLAPRIGADYLLTFDNLQVHLITPLLMIVDYTLLTARGKLKKRDPFLFALVPVIYFVQATILGFSGVHYFEDILTGEVTHFPYFFVDYHKIGWGVALYATIILTAYTGISYLIFLLDRSLAARASKKINH